MLSVKHSTISVNGLSWAPNVNNEDLILSYLNAMHVNMISTTFLYKNILRLKYYSTYPIASVQIHNKL